MTWLAIHRDTIASTNAEALKLVEDGERRKFWVRADTQTAGRGRSGRAWQSLSGNLAVSFTFETDAAPQTLSQLSLVAGIAVAEALKPVMAASAPALRLKWPNDILLGAAKVGGILVESTTIDHRRVVIVGAGVNVAQAPQLPGQETAAVQQQMTATMTLDSLAAAIAEQLDQALEVWDQGRNFGSIRASWCDHGLKPGTAITVRTADGPQDGAFQGLDDDGALLFRAPNGDIGRISVGDVTLAD